MLEHLERDGDERVGRRWWPGSGAAAGSLATQLPVDRHVDWGQSFFLWKWGQRAAPKSWRTCSCTACRVLMREHYPQVPNKQFEFGTRSRGHPRRTRLFIENCLESKTNFYFWPLPFSSLLPTCMDLSICDSKSFGIHMWQILDTCSCEIQGFGKIKHQKNVTKISQTRSQMRYDIYKKKESVFARFWGVFSEKMYASRAGGLVGRPDTGASVTYVLPVHVPCSHKTREQVVPCSCSLKSLRNSHRERWGAGVETQKNVRGEIGGWGRVPFNETYAPSLRTIYDGA